MEDLKAYRDQIDGIDSELIPLFERRMEISRKVAAYKKEKNLPVLQSGREQEVLEKAEASLLNKAYAPYARQLMSSIMELSRAAQHADLGSPGSGGPGKDEGNERPVFFGRAGYPGVEGSFSEQALLDFFGEGKERAAYTEFEDVFAALERGEIHYGVVPIENSSTGSITKVYDLLGSYGFVIVGEQGVRIRQNLAGLPGADVNMVKTVYSHTQGIEQSSAFLSKHRDWELLHFHNTAISAKMVAESKDPGKAAICSDRAAALYGLQILARDIQDNDKNTTRFLVVGKKAAPEGANKVSIAFSLDHQSGTLHNVLRHFAQNQINMVKIESRPIPEMLWNYRFYLDFQGSPDAPAVMALLESLERETKDFRYLGAYQASTI